MNNGSNGRMLIESPATVSTNGTASDTERRDCSSHPVIGEFAERVPEYLREGYYCLMRCDGQRAIELWRSLYERYPSAEVCGHLARAHYYQIFFLNHDGNHPLHAEHVREMRLWAERALLLNPNSSIGHAMLAGALAREARLTGSRREIVEGAWQVRYHAERAIQIDNGWIGHYIMALWHREIASVSGSKRAMAQLLHGRKLPRGSFEEAISHFDEVLRQQPDNNVMYAEIAFVYYDMGDLENARRAYRRFVEMPPFRHPITQHLTIRFREHYDALLLNK